MESSAERRKTLLARIFFAAGVLVLGLFLGINFLTDFEMSDDILLLDRAYRQSVHQIFTTSFFTNMHVFYYRPFSVLFTKMLLTPELSVLPYRLLQLALALTSATLLILYLKRHKVSTMGLAAGLILLASCPFIRSAITWWGDCTTLVNITVLMITITLFDKAGSLGWSLNEKGNHKSVHWFLACVLTTMALLWKELGLIIALLFLIHYFTRRRYASFVAIVLVVIGYFALRTIALGSALPTEANVTYQSAFIVQYQDSEHIRQIFGNFPYPYYLYNVMAQLTMLFFGQPIEGAFIFHSGRYLFLTFLQIACSALIFFQIYRKKITVPFLFWVIILASALISYRYTNVRQMPLAAIIWIILFSQAIDSAWKSSGKYSMFLQPFSALLLTGWIGFAGLIVLADDFHHLRIEDKNYVSQETAPRPDLMPDPSLYLQIRSRHLPTD